jgi:long-chain fatty acid transport protein
MKKILATTALLMCFGVVFAGGLLTNANQSAQYMRILSRNASTSVDAVYFNPAGLMKMNNGFFISVNSQYLDQTKTINSYFPLLNTPTYEGQIIVPVFPTAFAIYKKDRIAYSLGIGPNSGGGSAEFDSGLPSFEKPISKLVPGLAGLSKLNQSITNYSTDISFKGESIFWGIQGGVSYKLSDMFSAYAGLRYVPAKNKYTGSITNIQLKVNGSFVNASSYLSNTVSPMLTGMANQSTAAATSVQPLIAAGAGNNTIAQVQGAGYMTAAQRAQLEGGLLVLGYTSAQINVMPLSGVQSAYNSGAAMLNSQAAQMDATGKAVKDKAVDVEQTGWGITPILGLNISPVEGLNIGMKYEFKTKLELTNATKVDGTGMFPDKATAQSDIPAIFAVGVDYKFTKKFSMTSSLNLYNDKGVNWGNNIYGEPRIIQHNEWEWSLGGQYQIVDWVAVSLGYMRTQMGIYEQFNSDFSFYSPSNSFAGGFELKPMNNLTIDLGFLVTNYDTVTKGFKDPDAGSYFETYDKHNVGLAIGLAYHFGGK